MTQMAPALIVAMVAFLLPGLVLAIIAAFVLRTTRRVRAWVRITLLLTVVGLAMWTLAVRYQAVALGSLQLGSMAAIVASVSAVLAGVAVLVVPRRRLVSPPPPPVAPRSFSSRGDSA